MTKQTETKQAEPAIRELSAEEMIQAGGGIVVHERRGRDIWVQRNVVVHD